MLALEFSGLNPSFQGLKCVVVGYGPNEGNGEEREKFWSYLDEIEDRVGNGYRLCVLGNLKGLIVNRARVGITDAFEVQGENDNGRRVVEFCAEKGLWPVCG